MRHAHLTDREITARRLHIIINKLKINDDKTEFLIIKSPYSNFPGNIQLLVGQKYMHSLSACKILGVMLDKHGKQICRATHFHLWNVRAIILLTDNATAQLVHSLITSRLYHFNSLFVWINHCNFLLYGLPDSKIAVLQRIQNIASRIITH